MTDSDLAVAAARYALGIPCEDDRKRFGPQLETLFDREGLPSRDEAVWTLLRHHISRIADRAIPPREGLRKVLDEAYFAGQLYEQQREVVGDSHGIERLYGAYYAYDDLAERPEVSFEGVFGTDAIAKLNEQVVLWAQEWIGNHPA